MAVRSGEPFRLQIYEFLNALAQGGVQSQLSEMNLSNGEDQGASGTGLGVLISPMVKVFLLTLSEILVCVFCRKSATLIDIYRTKHNISASADPAVATGISDLMYESKPAPVESDALDDDLVNAWAANLGDGGLLDCLEMFLESSQVK
ncbi:SH3 DOMAIN-CONTAINING PROTEIN [Salix purpurea]|uniref:SH3 DOMAIN-CONTAINING PROTEIN n=1 Tax=Salix purpurea TaxID=77065 RepID=A0A9Q0UL93_SALPP|nr:SH3 DOMAIN-CONTAINING PROTEIN [Salix purpurea]